MSGYTPKLIELIKKAEATRPQRLEKARRGEHFPALTMEERSEGLKNYHPDYKSEGRRKLLAGPNKGMVMPEEVAAALESKSRLLPAAIDLSKT
ncbi:MAG: succinate dehydrogenase/fumarate reductase flavoprotein subunit, partial [Deltaproteobacteria bacterium]